MNSNLGSSVVVSPPKTSFAIVCIAVWVAAVVTAGSIGIWLAIGGASIVLGIAVLVLDWPGSREILRPRPRLILIGTAAGGLMAAATYVLYPMFARMAPVIANDTAALYSAFRGPSLAVASLVRPPGFAVAAAGFQIGGTTTMPHVVIEEVLDLAAACAAIRPSALREGSDILKVTDVYLNQAGRTALVDCVAIEQGRPQTFFVQLSQKERQVTVRLLPATDPEKTGGVKRLMALIARQLRDAIVGSRFGKTNLQQFLADGQTE